MNKSRLASIAVLLFVHTFISCKKKDTNCYGEITVLQSSAPVSGANVWLHQVNISENYTTDNSGKVNFTFKSEAILKVDVTYNNLPTSETNIRLEPGETVKKTVSL